MKIKHGKKYLTAAIVVALSSAAIYSHAEQTKSNQVIYKCPLNAPIQQRTLLGTQLTPDGKQIAASYSHSYIQGWAPNYSVSTTLLPYAGQSTSFWTDIFNRIIKSAQYENAYMSGTSLIRCQYNGNAGIYGVKILVDGHGTNCTQAQDGSGIFTCDK